MLRLIHSTLLCPSAVTKLVYYHQCMIINMYQAITPSSNPQPPTDRDRPKQTVFLLQRGESIRKRCTQPWHQPSTAESAREVEWVFVLASTNTHSIPASVNLLSSMICAPLNSMIDSHPRTSLKKLRTPSAELFRMSTFSHMVFIFPTGGSNSGKNTKCPLSLKILLSSCAFIDFELFSHCAVIMNSPTCLFHNSALSFIPMIFFKLSKIHKSGEHAQLSL